MAKGYLRHMIQYLKRPEVGLASCVYLGTVDESEGKAGLSAHLDAVGKSVEMTSGVMVADMLGSGAWRVREPLLDPDCPAELLEMVARLAHLMIVRLALDAREDDLESTGGDP